MVKSWSQNARLTRQTKGHSGSPPYQRQADSRCLARKSQPNSPPEACSVTLMEGVKVEVFYLCSSPIGFSQELE